jgi:hypothetical protein
VRWRHGTVSRALGLLRGNDAGANEGIGRYVSRQIEIADALCGLIRNGGGSVGSGGFCVCVHRRNPSQRGFRARRFITPVAHTSKRNLAYFRTLIAGWQAIESKELTQ